MYAIGLYPLIDRPTRISNQSFSLIDNIFTNVTNYNITSGILINDITDHLPVFAICTYPNPNRQIKKLYIKKRIVIDNNITTLIGNLTNIQLYVGKMYSILSKWTLHMQNLCLYFLICIIFAALLKPHELRLHVVIRKTDCIKYGFIIKRLQLNPYNFFYKSKFTSILRAVEKEHYSKLLSDAKGNLKGAWKIVNAAINKKELY